MRYLVKINELEEKLNFMEKQLDIIDNDIESIKKLKSSINWEGESYQNFINKYDLHVSKLEEIRKKMISCLLYLGKYCDRYGEFCDDFKKKYENYLNNEVL